MRKISTSFGAMLVLLIAVLVIAPDIQASSDVQGTVRKFNSPGGTTERCVALEHMPGGRYTDADKAK